MKKGWTVTLEGRAAKALDPIEVMDHLTDFHAVVSYGDGVLSTTATVPATNPMQALDFLYEALSEFVGKMTFEYGMAMTEERQEQELEVSNLPDLVGLAEIAELAGTSRQRVFQMTANKDFPAALLELRSGRLWSRPAITSYLQGRGPRLKTLSGQVGGRQVAAMTRSKAARVASRRK